MEELFIGIETTNLHKFESTCCGVGLSIEPLCKVCCGNCGRNVLDNKEYRLQQTDQADADIDDDYEDPFGDDSWFHDIDMGAR